MLAYYEYSICVTNYSTAQSSLTSHIFTFIIPDWASSDENAHSSHQLDVLYFHCSGSRAPTFPLARISSIFFYSFSVFLWEMEHMPREPCSWRHQSTSLFVFLLKSHLITWVSVRSCVWGRIGGHCEIVIICSRSVVLLSGQKLVIHFI